MANIRFGPGNSDILISTAGDSYLGEGGDDTYIIDPNAVQAGDQINIVDSQGANVVRLVGGLEITAALVASNALQLTLSNGAVIFVDEASSFSFEVGGDTFDPATTQTFEELAASLGTTVPADGDPPNAATNTGVVNDDGSVGGAPDGLFTLSQDVDQVNEGSTVTYTVTLDQAAETDTTVSFQVSPDADAGNQGTTLANFDDFPQGSLSKDVTILTGATEASFTVTPVTDALTELTETYDVTATIDGDTEEVSTDILDGSISGGQAFTLTSNADSLPGLIGSQGTTDTSGNDTIVGADDTLGPADVLNGGTGNDTLLYASSGDGNVTEAGFTTDSIETFKITSDLDDETDTTTFDMTNVSDLMSLVNDNSSANLTVTGLDMIVPLTLADVTGGDTVGTYDNVAILGDNDTQALTLDNVAGLMDEATTSVTVNGIENFEITTQNQASFLTQVASDDLTQVTVSGDQNLTITDGDPGTVNDGLDFDGSGTFDATGFIADLNIEFNDSGNDALTVIFGDGDDLADFTAGFDDDDSLDGGDGDDTIGLTNALATGGAEGTVVRVEQLSVTNEGDGTIELNANFPGITRIEYDEGFVDNGDVTVSDAPDGVLVEVDLDDSDADLTVELTTDGSDDEVTLKLDEADNTPEELGTVTVDDAETLTINAVDTSDNGTGAVEIDTLSGKDLTTLIITGDADLTILNSDDDTRDGLTTIDASGFTGDLDIDALGGGDTGLTVTGGTGDDQITGSADTNSDAIDAGAGDDTITGSEGQDTLTGGPGDDVFDYNKANESSGSTVDTITDFARGEDIVNLDGLGILTSSRFLGTFANQTTAETDLTSGGDVEAAFIADINSLVVDSNNNGDIDTNDFLVVLTGISDFDAADLGLVGGATITATGADFDTTIDNDPNSTGGPATNEDDTINADENELFGSNIDGLLGEDTLNIDADDMDVTLPDGGGAYDGIEIINVDNLDNSTVTLGNVDDDVEEINGDSSVNDDTLALPANANLEGVEVNEFETVTSAGGTLTIDEDTFDSDLEVLTGGGGILDLAVNNGGAFDFSDVELSGFATIRNQAGDVLGETKIDMSEQDTAAFAFNATNAATTTAAITITGTTGSQNDTVTTSDGNDTVSLQFGDSGGGETETVTANGGTDMVTVSVTNGDIAADDLLLDGGPGTDTLDIEVQAATNVTTNADDIELFETINVNSSAAGGNDVTITFKGDDLDAATTINLDSEVDGNITIDETAGTGEDLDVNFEAVAASAYVVQTGAAASDNVVTVAFEDDNAIDVAADTFDLGGGTGDELIFNIGNEALSGVVGTLTNIETFTVNGTANVGLLTIDDTDDFITVDLSGVSGDVNIDISGFTGANTDATVRTGSGNDTFTGGVDDSGGDLRVDVGSGNDNIPSIVGDATNALTLEFGESATNNVDTNVVDTGANDFDAGDVFDFTNIDIASLENSLDAGNPANSAVITNDTVANSLIQIDVNGNGVLDAGQDLQVSILGQLLTTADFAIVQGDLVFV